MKASAPSATSATSATPEYDNDHAMPDGARDALSFSHVSLSYRIDGRDCDVLHDLSFRIRRGEAYGLVGESGCGKSTVALAAVRYLPRGGKQRQGQIHIVGERVDMLDATALRHLRAHQVSMIYQDAGSALNPSMTVGRQLIEAFQIAPAAADKHHSDGSRRSDLAREAEAMLTRVRIDTPAHVMRQYPHQLSGGMQQRIVIAMALASRPALLILDEPTTGLDSTVEAEVLSLLREIRDADSLSMLFISHDLAVVASICDRVGILYAGELVEEGDTAQVLSTPGHPYTVGLLRCLPAGHTRAGAGGLATIPGEPPPLGTHTDACAFAGRCGLARPTCIAAAPSLYDVDATAEPRRSSHSPRQSQSQHARATSVHLSRCYFHQEAGALPFVASLPDAEPTVHRPGTAEHEKHLDTRADDAHDGRTHARSPILRVIGVSKTFYSGQEVVKALDDVSFALHAGQTLGLVGESGSGKSTLANVLLGLETPDEGGAIELDDRPLPSRVTHRSPEQIRAMQIVFQHPDAALNRAWSVRRLVSRSIRKLLPVRSASDGSLSARALAARNESRLHDLLAAVRLAPRFLSARTAALSGGLKQRVAIASAFAGEPQIVICDEPTSALDVSVQAAILNLLTDLQRRRGVSYLFISHDLEVIRYLADRIAVLYRGRIVEIGPAESVLSGPNHPYTATLVSAAWPPAPLSEWASASAITSSTFPQSAVAVTASALPESTDAAPDRAPSGGCVFAPRCPLFLGDICEHERPELRPIDADHALACHLPTDRLPRPSQDEVREEAKEETPVEAKSSIGGMTAVDRTSER